MASRNDSLNAKKFLGICLWTSHAIKIDSYAFQNNLPSGRHSIPTQLGAKMLYIFFLTLSINSSLSHISQPSTYFTPSVREDTLSFALPVGIVTLSRCRHKARRMMCSCDSPSVSFWSCTITLDTTEDICHPSAGSLFSICSRSFPHSLYKNISGITADRQIFLHTFPNRKP